MEIRFTEKATAALGLAKERASQSGCDYIGTEHILLGILLEGSNVAAKILENYNVSVDMLEAAIAETMGDMVSHPGGDPKLTPRSKRVLDRSVQEAVRYGSLMVGTEHILLALLAEYDSYAVKCLSLSGVDVSQLAEEVIAAIRTGATGGAESINASAKSGTAGNKNLQNINQFGRDLTQMARENKIDPIIGRDKEIRRVMQVLCRRTKNNPCLIGEPGVGKTAIAEGLAQIIASGNVPEMLKDKAVISLDLTAMVAGTKYRGEFEDRLKKTIDEVRSNGNIILFIDEIHTIIGAGAAEGAMDAANILKPSLSRAELQVIGATTLDEYRKHIEKDAALERRFQPVLVDEPDAEATIKILHGIRDKFEAHHNVIITDEALQAAVEMSQRYINDRFLPDKAIDLIDEAASRKRMQVCTMPPEINRIEQEIESLRQQKEQAVANQEFEKAADFRDQEKKASEELKQSQEKWAKENKDKQGEIGEQDIADIVSDWTGIPVSKLGEDEGQRLLRLESTLHERVIGQDAAVKAIAKAIRRGRTGLKDPKRPIGSFIFLGPTGVGKTELSKTLAETLFGDEKALIRVDMSEYMEKHSVSRMVGSPPGYVGYDDGGQLTEKVRRKPYSVILFDEIEKAHPDVFNLLLQILEDGRLTDSQGRVVDFKNTVIIMTSNVGARNITEPKKLGFSAGGENAEADYENMRRSVMEELKRTFRPEFLNRVDDIIVFQPLNRDEIKQIAGILLRDFGKRAKENGISLVFDDSVLDFVADKGYDPIFGARPLKRAIQSNVEDKLAEFMLSGEISGGEVIVLYKNGEVVFEKK